MESGLDISSRDWSNYTFSGLSSFYLAHSTDFSYVESDLHMTSSSSSELNVDRLDTKSITPDATVSDSTYGALQTPQVLWALGETFRRCPDSGNHYKVSRDFFKTYQCMIASLACTSPII